MERYIAKTSDAVVGTDNQLRGNAAHWKISSGQTRAVELDSRRTIDEFVIERQFVALSGETQFFILPEELVEFLGDFVWSRGLVILAENFRTKILTFYNAENAVRMCEEINRSELIFGRIVLESSLKGIKPVDAMQPIRAGQWRTMIVDFPAWNEGRLLMSSLHFKVDRSMGEGGLPDPEALFKFLRGRLRPRLHKPVWVYSPIDRKPRLVKGVGYTDGVREFCRKGGVLQQRGAAWFSITAELPPA